MSPAQAPAQIEVCGGIASGKTTLSNVLRNCGFEPVLEQYFKNPFLPSFYSNPQQYAFETELTFLLQHYSQVKNLEHGATYSCDFSFLQDDAYASVNLAGQQRLSFADLLKQVRAELSSPKLLIYLKCSPKCEYERIIRRGREQEKGIKLDYLAALNAAVEEKVLSTKLNVLLIDSEAINFASSAAGQIEVCYLIREGQERTKHVAADGRVGLVIDRPCVEDCFGRLENIFDAQELAVAQHNGERIEGRIGAQDIEAVVPRILDDAIVVDLEMLLVGRLQVTTVGAVADEGFVAATQSATQMAQHRLAHLGVALGLGEVAADNIAATAEANLLGLQFGVAPSAARDDERHARSWIVQHDLLHLLGRALTHTQDIFEAALFEAGDGLRTDHAAIGHHADPADSEALAQAVDHRDERGDVGSVAVRRATSPSILVARLGP